MITTIIKRDGRRVPFDIDKIANVISKAFIATDEDISKSELYRMAEEVFEHLEGDSAAVEHVQDVVERVLIERGKADAAKAYILYRANRTRVRDMRGGLMRVFDDITHSNAKDSDLKRENANIDGDTAMGVMLKYGSEGAKHYYMNHVLRPEHARAHREGDIHIHDMDFLTLTTTCCQIDILKLFDGGFSTGHGALREPQDIASYSALACIAIQSNQNDQHGGQSIVNFDRGMAPGVRKTHRKLYIQHMARALELLGDIDGADAVVREIVTGIEQDGEPLTLEISRAFLDRETEALAALGANASVIKKAQAYAAKHALEDTNRATFQAMEALVHNLNTMHSRCGAQTPFSSINYGLDMSPEGRMVIKNVLLAQEKGLGGGETPIFPIHIFRVMKGVNYDKGDPGYDLFRLAMRVSASRMFPNFAFQDAPFNIQYYDPADPRTEIAYMGCRTRVIGNVYDTSNQISYGRGNLSFTSVNLPRLAMRADGDVDVFFHMLDETMDMVIQQMNDRFEHVAGKTIRNFPFLMGEGVWLDSEKLAPDQPLRETLKHGTLSMGFIGLAEALKALTGEHHGESARAQALGLRIIGHMRARMDEESIKTRMNYTLLATPAEGLSGRFVNIDKKHYGIIEGVTDREYYTNSFHIPVYHRVRALDKIMLEAPYHALTNAGHITYVELDGEAIRNPDAFESIIRAMHDAGIGYGSINHPLDRDPACGYSGVIGDICPKCNRDTHEGVQVERIRRVTGYLAGTLDRFNDAKRAEERDRIKHVGKDAEAEPEAARIG